MTINAIILPVVPSAKIPIAMYVNIDKSSVGATRDDTVPSSVQVSLWASPEVGRWSVYGIVSNGFVYSVVHI